MLFRSNTSLLSVLLSGGTLVFHQRKLLPQLIAKSLVSSQANILVAFPVVYDLLLSQGYAHAAKGLRLAVSSAAPLTAEVRKRWKAETGLSICDYYGLAEVGPCTFNDGSDPHSIGAPLPGVKIKITGEGGEELPAGSVGRIRVHTTSMASDYLDTTEPFFRSNLDDDGYFVTKDEGFVTEENQLILTGRTGRIINIGGRKVEPLEVEMTLRQMTGVRDVVVRGEERNGRAVLAAFIESETVTRQEIVDYCISRMAQYKIPQLITVMTEFPRSSAGKPSLSRLEIS